jgi:type II secretory pathway component PulK
MRRSVANARGRTGSALVVVLVVIVVLTLGVYTFTETMILEREATTMAGRDAQARAFAESGVEYAAAILGLPDEATTENIYHNPQAFAGVLQVQGATPRSTGRFSIVAPVETDVTATQIRYGLGDESGKINVNALPTLVSDPFLAREMLMYLPNMTENIADAILDYVDTDDDARDYGAESSVYEAKPIPYAAKNGPIDSVDELLLVEGITPQMLYGEDANRNGLLDPNENDGEASLPWDNADGILDPGWQSFLTANSREKNTRQDGSAKIDINQAMLTELYDELQAELGDDVATFIIAFRMNGATNVPQLEGISSGVASTGSQETDGLIQEITTGIAKQVLRGTEGSVTRGGMDLSAGGSYQFGSLYELVGAEVEATVEEQMVTLSSPWPADPGSLATTLPALFDTLTIGTAETKEGRINVNQARREVLAGIPYMPPEAVDAIVQSQVIGSNGEAMSDQIAIRATTGWLLINGIITDSADGSLTAISQMRMIDPYVTARGDVYRVQSLGHFDTGGPVCRVEAIIDASTLPAKVTFHRDISQLGPGYRVQEIPRQQTATTIVK